MLVKTLEDEMFELEDGLTTILTESAKFKIDSKAKLNLITKYVTFNTKKQITEGTNTSKVTYRHHKTTQTGNCKI